MTFARDNIFRSLCYCLVIIAIGQVSLKAQTAPVDTVTSLTGVSIETSVDRGEIFIGDLVNYTLIIKYDSTLDLIPPPLGANLGAFDVKDFQTDIISHLDDGRIQSENRFVISTFTTGDYFVPPIPVVFDLPDGSRKILLSETVPIKVKSLLTDTEGEIDIKPLTDPVEFKRDYTTLIIWSSVALLLLIVAAILFWRYRNRAKADKIDLRPAWEVAFEQLALLEQKDVINKEGFKAYYLEITEIARWYLGRMFQQNVLDMTTEEFLERFEDIDLSGNLYPDLSSFLKHADLVKFARYQPEQSRADDDFKLVHMMIEEVRRDYERKQAALEQLRKEKGEVVGEH